MTLAMEEKMHSVWWDDSRGSRPSQLPILACVSLRRQSPAKVYLTSSRVSSFSQRERTRQYAILALHSSSLSPIAAAGAHALGKAPIDRALGRGAIASKRAIRVAQTPTEHFLG